MSQHTSVPFRSTLVLASTLFAAFALPAAAATDARLSESYGKLPLYFEANRGQTDKDVRFLSRGAGYGLYLTSDEAVLVLTKPGVKGQRKSVALRMSLVGAASKLLVSGLEEQPGKANYFVGQDRSKWRTNVPTYAKVQYKNVYPGIDLVYYGKQRQLEYDFVVAPGADPNKIVLGFKGAKNLEIDSQGDLVLHAPGGDIRQHKPVVYQEIEGVRREIDGRYAIKPGKRVGFKVAAYDTTRPLVIDPIVLQYSTYLGGLDGDFASAIAVDADGNTYVAGATLSPGFPTTAGAFQSSFPGGFAAYAFVTKLNPSGTALVYSTYLGSGNGPDSTTGISAVGIAVDSAGDAYVTGHVLPPANYPTTPGAFQPANAGAQSNAFVTKLDSTGSALVYSTFLGGSSSDSATGIALDADGNAYVTGTASSTDFPTTAGAFQTTLNGGFVDLFVTKLNPAGSALVYSTYLGGSGQESGGGIAVDTAGNAYVAGSTQSNDFPTTAGAFQTTFGGTGDAFVTKLDPTGSALVFSTYLRNAAGAAIAVDVNRNAYVTGRTFSANFPTTAGAFQTTFGPGGGFSTGDAFVTKFDPTGSSLVYSTYLGGSDGGESGNGIAVDAAGNAYVAGDTASTDFPTTVDAFQRIYAGGNDVFSFRDAFITKLDPTGSALVYSTYLGGSKVDLANGIAVDSGNNIYVAGSTNSAGFPTTPGAFQAVGHTGGGFNGHTFDAFVAKFVDLAPPPPPTPTASGTTRSEESAATQIGFWTSYGQETGTFSGGTIVASNVAASSAMFSFTGTAVSWIGVRCNVCGIAAVSVDGGVPTTVDTAGPGAPGGLSSESVFSASGLAAGNHTIAIVVTGMSNSGGSYVALDAFDVTAGSASAPILPSVVLSPPPVTLPPLPPLGL